MHCHVVKCWKLCEKQPLKAKGWDKALVEFTVATLTDNNGSEKKPPLSKRFQEIKCPGNISDSVQQTCNFH